MAQLKDTLVTGDFKTTGNIVGVNEKLSGDCYAAQFYETTSSSSAPSGSITGNIATLSSSGWSNNSQTITVQGVTSSNIVIVSPAPASANEYTEAQIQCTAQAANSLTFSCGTVPSDSISVNVVII